MGRPASLLHLPVERPCSVSSRGPVTSCCPSSKNELARDGCGAWRIGWQGLGLGTAAACGSATHHCCHHASSLPKGAPSPLQPITSLLIRVTSFPRLRQTQCQRAQGRLWVIQTSHLYSDDQECIA